MNGELLAGVWKTCISPPVYVSLEGSFTDIKAIEILDDLYSHAIVFDDGNKKVAIVSVDICMIPDDIFHDIAGRIKKRCNIQADHLFIASTHTHTGPKLADIFADVGGICQDYVEYFKNMVVTSVVMAEKKKHPVVIGAGKGTNDLHTYNRRLKKPDGSIVMNWVDKGFLQDCIETGPVDPEVEFVVVSGTDGKPVSFIINYANHNNAVCMPVISADWSGYLRRTLEKVYGSDIVVLYLPGACGNINWIDYRNQNQGSGSDIASEIGTSVAGTVIENLSKVEYSHENSIDSICRKLVVENRPFNAYDTCKDNTFGLGEDTSIIYAQYEKEKQYAGVGGIKSSEVIIQAVRIGEHIAIVSNPGEIFVEFGLDIKKDSPFKYTLISELTNGYKGYICTKEAFREGGYEVRRTNFSSCLDVNAGESIVNNSIDILDVLKKRIHI